MFGALNRFIGRLDSEPARQASSQNLPDSTSGFQILKNTNPDLPLEPWFDFIIGINGHFLESSDPALFTTEIHNCAGGYCSLDLWSAKGQRAHSLTIAIPPPSEPLGLTLQLAPLNSTYNIWHILTIPSPLSPAHVAGLLPHSDYILGSPSGTLRGESAFGELVEDHLNRSLVLWVYNSEFDVVREVELIPRRGWGGDGALGAVLGFGALHRLPVGLSDEVQAPGEKLFDAERKSTDILNNGGDESFQQAPPPTAPPVAPPPMVNPNVPPPSMMNPNTAPQPAAPSRARKGKHHGALSPGSGFDDIFAEGQKKSAEQDHIPSRKGTPLAPPPKLGSAPITPHTESNEAQDPMNVAGEDLGEPGDAEEA